MVRTSTDLLVLGLTCLLGCPIGSRSSETTGGLETSASETGGSLSACEDFVDRDTCEAAVGAVHEEVETQCVWLPIYEMSTAAECTVTPTNRGLCLAVEGNDSGCDNLDNACGVDLLELYAREIDGAVELVYDPDASCRGPGLEWTNCLGDGMGGVQHELCGCACDFVP